MISTPLYPLVMYKLQKRLRLGKMRGRRAPKGYYPNNNLKCRGCGGLMILPNPAKKNTVQKSCFPL